MNDENADYLFESADPVTVPWWFMATPDVMVEHDRAVAEKAWNEGRAEELAYRVGQLGDNFPVNPYHPESVSTQSEETP